jgi:hypothetical protein
MERCDRSLRFIRLTPGYAATLLNPAASSAVVVRIRFSGRSFVRSSPESLQPNGFPLCGRGAEVLFPFMESRQISIVSNCNMTRWACQENNLPTYRQVHVIIYFEKGGLLQTNLFILRKDEQEITVWLQKSKR